MTQPRYSICMTELATEIPRCFSISIQSEVACREALRAFTLPAMWIAPAKSRSFSVSVVLPASGCEMIAKVRRRVTSWGTDIGFQQLVLDRPSESKGLILKYLAHKRDPAGSGVSPAVESGRRVRLSVARGHNPCPVRRDGLEIKAAR